MSKLDRVLMCMIPVRTVSEANMREHWATKARRKKDHTHTARLVTGGMLAHLRASDWVAFALAHGGIRIKLTRCGARRLDPDNLAGSFKGVQDGIAAALGVDDGDVRLEWRYEQAKAPKRSFGVMVEVEARAVADAVAVVQNARKGAAA